MKNKLINIFGLLFLVSAIVVSSCKKDDDDGSNCVDGPAATISSISPNPQIQTGEATISGSNLSNVNHVFVGQIEAEIVNQSDGSLTFIVPLSAELGENEVTLANCNNKRATTTLAVDILPAPIITNITPWVPIGGELVITGTSLENNAVVTIDGVQADIVSTDGVTLVAIVPAGIPDDNYLDLVVTNDFGTFESPIPFFPRENILLDGQLNNGEGDEFTSWEKLNGGEFMTELRANDAFAGGRSIRVEPPGGNPWDSQLASTPVQLEFGESYTALFWAKGEAAGAEMRISASQWDGNGADYFYSHGNDEVGFELSSSGWTAHAVSFEVTNDLPEHKIVFDMGKGSVPFGIDHMALVKGALGDVGGGPAEELMNGSFEDGLNNWEILNGVFETSADANCGTQSLTATGVGGNPWDVQLASTPLMLEVGTTYELGFWAKAAGPDGIMRASVSRFASGQMDDFFYTPDITVAEEWTYYSYAFEAMPTSTGDYNVVLDFGQTTQTFFVDGITLKKYDPSPSIYPNSDFEDGLNSWMVLNGNFDTSSDAFEGGSSLTATGAGGNPWDVQLASEPLVLDVDQQYKLSFWAKAAGPDGVMRASVSRFASGQTDDFFYTPDITVAEEWTFYGFIFTAQATSTGDHNVVLDFGATTQTFFLDDLRLTEVDPCE